VAEDDPTLSLALESLRDGLEEARAKGRGRKVRFEMSEVPQVIETELRKDTEASGGVRWSVLRAGVTRKTGAGATQNLVLTFTPPLHGEEGNRSPLKLHADQPRPGS
jgi:NTP-dependent ternary system trypsin peptidase co-occuring protein